LDLNGNTRGSTVRSLKWQKFGIGQRRWDIMHHAHRDVLEIVLEAYMKWLQKLAVAKAHLLWDEEEDGSRWAWI